MWLSLYVLLFINIPGWTGQVKSVCFLLTAFLTYENNLFYCSRLFPTFPRDHRVLLLRVGEGWCVLFWSVEKLVHFIATAALPRTVTELCNRNIKSYIYIEREMYTQTVKQTKNTGLLSSNCLHRILCILVHSSSAYPEMFLLFCSFFKQSRRRWKIKQP